MIPALNTYHYVGPLNVRRSWRRALTQSENRLSD
jgi:hypothetical protein